MKRWLKSALLGLSLLLPAAWAQEGIIREAPKDVQPGIIAVDAPPVIVVDGKEDRLSPGARIRDFNNMLVLSSALAGQTVYTVYRRDAAGLVHEVWLLTRDEYKALGGKVAGPSFLQQLNLIFSSRDPGVWK